tara:strand:+ start:868 stop:1269 length:402 start_codon:yes stop_codon:yes gene_type:complete
MEITYRTFKEIKTSGIRGEWRWDGKKMEWRNPRIKHRREWKPCPTTTPIDLLGDASIMETTPAPDTKIDMVNSPSHYKAHASGVECIQITEHMSFCLGNAVKYIWRADEKGKTIEDLKKARWYIDREITLRQA